MQATTPEDNSFFSREKEELPRVGRTCTCHICMQIGIVNRNIIFFRREPWLLMDFSTGHLSPQVIGIVF